MNDLFAKYFLDNLQDCKHSKKSPKNLLAYMPKKFGYLILKTIKAKYISM